MKVWTVNGITESGDEWGMVFNAKPTYAQIEEYIKADDWLREEYEAECIQGWTINEEEVIEL